VDVWERILQSASLPTMGTADNVPLTIELQASLDPGFVGHYTEEGRDGKSKHQFQIHLHFGKDSILEGGFGQRCLPKRKYNGRVFSGSMASHPLASLAGAFHSIPPP